MRSAVRFRTARQRLFSLLYCLYRFCTSPVPQQICGMRSRSPYFIFPGIIPVKTFFPGWAFLTRTGSCARMYEIEWYIVLLCAYFLTCLPINLSGAFVWPFRGPHRFGLRRFSLNKRRVFPLKRTVGILLAVVFLALLAACGIPSSTGVAASAPAPSPTVAATSRDVHSEPVKVDETYAMADVISPTETPAATAAPTAAATPAASTAPTPSTGDAPVVYMAGAIGLILFCSAGLLMLKRI